jgi:L-threonylcarbamoyladenylate synthase
VTEVIAVDPVSPDAAAVARAAAVIATGGLVAFPTETVYGLGAHALDRVAVQRLFAAKGRPASDPLIVHVASLDQALPLLASVPPAARELAARFWPGPLTLVMPRSARVPDEVTAGLQTVAVRVPSHPVARALLAAAAVPIAAPSANLFSRPSPTSAAHVMEDLDGLVDIVLDAGPTSVGVESTVVDLTRQPPVVLRPGAITLAMLRDLLPSVSALAPVALPPDSAMPSPGLLERHYSPRAPLTLYEGHSDEVLDRVIEEVRRARDAGRTVGVLASREDCGRLPSNDPGLHVVDVGSASDPPAVASRLYGALRELDRAGVDLILARGFPASDGLGTAIQDRLRRAAAGRITRVSPAGDVTAGRAEPEPTPRRIGRAESG